MLSMMNFELITAAAAAGVLPPAVHGKTERNAIEHYSNRHTIDENGSLSRPRHFDKRGMNRYRGRGGVIPFATADARKKTFFPENSDGEGKKTIRIRKKNSTQTTSEEPTGTHTRTTENRAAAATDNW